MTDHTPPPALERAVRYEGVANRPPGLILPPLRLPLRMNGKLRKLWRYVGVWTSDIAVYGGSAQIGPVLQQFWAVWDRRNRRMYERTRLFSDNVTLTPGRMHVKDRTKEGDEIEFEVSLQENEGFEVVTPQGRAYTWTRKQLIPASGWARVRGEGRRVEGLAFIDDNAGYHPRRTLWKWCGGVGRDDRGRTVGWNLIIGLNDTPETNENTVWLDGKAHAVGPVTFTGLCAVNFEQGGILTFGEEATRKQLDNLILLRSDYEQPIGTFTGTLHDGARLTEAFGVMERQDALW